MCRNTRQPRNSFVPSASLNSAAGVPADTLILESASFASWPCDRCAPGTMSPRIKWVPAVRFPSSQTDADSAALVVLFFLPFLTSSHSRYGKGRDGPRGGSGRKRTVKDKNPVFLSLSRYGESLSSCEASLFARRKEPSVSRAMQSSNAILSC